MEPEGSVAVTYHRRTCHSHYSVHASTHFLDWDIQPLPFKIYEDLEPIPLAAFLKPINTPMLDALSSEAICSEVAALDLAQLARILYYAAGVIRKRTYPGGQSTFFRAAACTGALYEIDLYVACGDLGEGIGAGLYHFSPHDFSLRLLRAGDCRGAVALALSTSAASAKLVPILDELNGPSTSNADAFIISGATFWRNSWKYEERTYRHFGWDNGTILANLLAAARAQRLPARISCAFIDDAINHLLGLNTRNEVAFSIVSLGRAAPHAMVDASTLPHLSLRTRPLSSDEVDYPLMREMHASSSLKDVEAVRRFTSAANVPPRRMAIPLPETPGLSMPAFASSDRSFHHVITHRGSTRRFARLPIRDDQFAAVMRCCMAQLSADFPYLCEAWLIVNAVEGVEPGAYFYRPEAQTAERGLSGELVPLKHGQFRAEAEYLDLEQALAGDASLNVYFMADLQMVVERLGDRGYRAAQLEAGIRGGRIYLAAYALGLGATGLTFYDDDVTRFFSPHATEKVPVFLMAVGKSVRKPSLR